MPESPFKVAGPATLFKKRLWHRCFPVNFAKFLRPPFFTEHLWWLLLNRFNTRSKTALDIPLRKTITEQQTLYCTVALQNLKE